MGTPNFEFDVKAGEDKVNLEFDPGFERYSGSMGQGSSCINTARAKAIGDRKESDYRVRAWWRTRIVNDPKVFAKFYKARLEELSLDHFNEKQAAAARKAGNPDPTPLTMKNVKDAADIMKAIIEDNTGKYPDATAKIAALYKQIYENPAINDQIKAMVTISLNNQEGREKRGYNAWMNKRKGTNWFFSGSMPDPTHPSKEKFQDVTGMYRFFEVYDTLNAIQAMGGISLKQTDENNFAIVSKGTDGVERPLIHSHIEEIPNTEGLKTTFLSHYTIDKDVQPEDMDQAICLLGEAIASHRQVCDVATANVAKIAGMKSPLQVMRLAEELICRYHMQVDLSDVKKLMKDAIDAYEDGPEKTALDPKSV